MTDESHTPEPASTLDGNATLIVVDAQVAFDDPKWGPRNNPDADANLAELISVFSETGRPIVVVRHDSSNPDGLLHPSQPGHQLKDYVRQFNADLLVTKSVNSSFHGSPDLHVWLRGRDVKQIVVAGMTTNHCCETTARVGGNLGYEVFFVLDATHTFDRAGPDGVTLSADDLARGTAANLHEEFATVTDTARVTRLLR
jgi:nicotinamidase-related amidase